VCFQFNFENSRNYEHTIYEKCGGAVFEYVFFVLPSQKNPLWHSKIENALFMRRKGKLLK
jgi:hypothetical protein